MIIRELVHHDRYLYFIQMDRIGPIKVGTAKNPFKRMNHMQTSSPYKLRMIYFTTATEEDEKATHCMYSKWHLRGEWFHPAKEIFDEIEQRKIIDKKNGFDWKTYNPEIDLKAENQIIL